MRSPPSSPRPPTRAPAATSSATSTADNVQANLVYDRKLTDWLDGVVELNFLDAKRDQIDGAGVPDPDTGGQSLYVTPRVGIHITRGLVMRASVQIPIWKHLNGIQDIKPAFSAGLTYVF